jgi:aryl-alcohol dehydrogenase-like predicted oxidoreductase
MRITGPGIWGPYASDIVIATKAGFVRTGPGEWVADAHPDRLRACVEGSLKRLRLDRIDLLQLHRIDPKVPVEESLRALVDLQNAGKIRRAKRTAKIVSVQKTFVPQRSCRPRTTWRS